MTKTFPLIALSLSLLLFGCAEPGRYPISGEECAPTDPVMDLDAADCMPVPSSAT
ncbi:hypothetical protein DEA8626_04180 [Defluviimonas aquaemixtae]|uniref:Lipoprotein n=1 Tax=Albidovulum aquaemixtae TaxID=1542388 RepID=A0A2R8BNX1_9RHOB|nr:hypothetical protein [Defluviimonas aquaemixtae]SPH25144.1 hypothetical protein DEA8626_04180 [Defluviimonas aquaemixtae]